MGKTALLRRSIAEATEEGYVVLFAEGSHYQNLASLFRRSLASAKDHLATLPVKLREAVAAAIRALPKTSLELPHEMGSINLEAIEKTADIPLVDAIADLNRAAHKHHRCVVIAIDEVQMVPVAQIEPIVSLIQETAASDAPLLFVGAGLPNSRAHLKEAKTYTERWRYTRLDLLSSADVAVAISEPLARQQIKIDGDALALLVRESHGYPFFVQEYGTAAWSVAENGVVTKAALSRVVAGVRKTLDDSLYAGAFENLTGRELEYVFAMVAVGHGPHRVGDVATKLGGSSESLNWLRNRLMKKDVIYSPGPGLIEFRLPLTELYVRRNRTELAHRIVPRRSEIRRGQHPASNERPDVAR